MQPAVDIVNSFKWVYYDMFYFVYIVRTIVIALKHLRCPLSDGFLSINDASTLSTHCHSPFSCVLMFSGRCITVRPNHRLMMGGVLRFRAGVGVGIKNRLQLRLRLQTKRSTPTDSNFGVNSESVALIKLFAEWTLHDFLVDSIDH